MSAFCGWANRPDQQGNLRKRFAMTTTYSYRDSHKYTDKGAEYEAHYATRPWQRFLWSREQQVLETILKKYFVGKDIHLLDFACGTGRIAGFLENRVTTCTGVDVSRSMLTIAREKLERTELIEADITVDNAIKGRKFNLITAFRFFVNAERPLRSTAMKVIAGLLSEDGYFIFNNHQNYGSLWIKLLYLRHKQVDPNGIFNVMTVAEMKSLVESVGLKIVELYPVGFFHPPKIPVPMVLSNVVENICCRLGFLARYSESPIAVCRWRRKRQQ